LKKEKEKEKKKKDLQQMFRLSDLAARQRGEERERTK